MGLEAWVLFCLTEIVLCFTPGPAVLLVVSVALSRGSRAGFTASLGILVANALYFALSATSLGVILRTSWQLFLVVKWLGAAYLAWLGIRMILASPGRLETAAVPERSRSTSSPLWLGLVAQGENPKALVFFTAILPQFIDPRGAAGLQVFVLGVSSVLIELAVLVLYVAVARTARAWAGRPRIATRLQRAGGLLLLGAGAQLAAIRR